MASVDGLQAPLRVVEFYAGVGGMHYALIESGVNFEIAASIDINTNANQVYQHNFPGTPHFNRNICGMTFDELDGLCPDAFVMSPPCQPFTRQGLRRDNFDRRTDSFFHIMQNLTEMKHLPMYILVENVQGFESSNTREHFVSILVRLGYIFQEFLLSPFQFGIPNSRLRYYLLAKRKPLQFFIKCPEQPSKDAQPLVEFVAQVETPEDFGFIPKSKPALESGTDPIPLNTSEMKEQFARQETKITQVAGVKNSPRDILGSLNSEFSLDTATVPSSTAQEPDSMQMSYSDTASASPLSVEVRPLSCYLQALSEDELKPFLVPEKVLKKYAIGLDIVQPSSAHSCCFTRAYSSYAVGTGSILQHATAEDLDGAFRKFLAQQKAGEVDASVQSLKPLKLRYFTPKEVANVMCFPPSFVFPVDLSLKQCYKVIGNTVNVHVVSTLMKYLFHGR